MSSRRPDEEPTGPPPEWADIVAPDDISELDDEVRALRAEWDRTSRASRLRRRFATRRRRGYEPSGQWVLVVLVVALFFASLGVFLQPAAPPAPAPRALAHPTASPGAADALLPDLALSRGRTGSFRLRNVRPAVVVVLPAECACTPLVTDVIAGTAASQLKVLVVGPEADPALPSTAPRSRAFAGTDTGGRLAAAFGAGATPLVLFIRSDGTVARVMPDARPGAEVRQEIAGLAH